MGEQLFKFIYFMYFPIAPFATIVCVYPIIQTDHGLWGSIYVCCLG